MKNIINFLLTMLALSCGDHTPSSGHSSPTASVIEERSKTQITFKANLSENQKNIIREIAKLYYDNFGIPKKIDILVSSSGECEERIAPNGSKLRSEAYTDKSQITICQNTLTKEKEVDFKNVIGHEFFHSVCSDSVTKIKPFKLKDGAIAIGFNGLTIVVKTPNGKITKFRKIEEGAADAFAGVLIAGYSVASPEQFSTGKMVIDKIKIGTFTAKDLITFQTTNDVVGFIAKWISKDRKLISMEDIEKVMMEFNDAWYKAGK